MKRTGTAFARMAVPFAAFLAVSVTCASLADAQGEVNWASYFRGANLIELRYFNTHWETRTPYFSENVDADDVDFDVFVSCKKDCALYLMTLPSLLEAGRASTVPCIGTPASRLDILKDRKSAPMLRLYFTEQGFCGWLDGKSYLWPKSITRALADLPPAQW